MFKISVFTVMIPDLTPEEAGQALRQHGYDGVEWRVTTPNFDKSKLPTFWANNFCTLAPTTDEAQRARRIADANGLETPGLGTYINVGEVAAVEQAMEFARICGARNVRVNPGRWPDPDGLSYADSYERARKFLGECEALGKRYGVRTIVEMHHGTIVCSAALSHRLVSHFDPDYIGVLHDAGNMVHEGFENYDMGLQLLGPYLAHVHIKNAAYERPDAGGVWKGRWSPLEDGVVDWNNLFSALRKANYNGWLGIEDFSGVRPTPEALPFNIQFLKDVIARVYEV
ncbi:MAG TPA: sugar phosphate isomerase/epimerase family protein [Spirillospora sp.]|nr:sugar phosphate isomerase/epimerase family protein [Spirillospora sp.]